MRSKLIRFYVLLLCLLVFSAPLASAYGTSPVLTHLKTGETGMATLEFIAIYNNSSDIVDVSGWCVVYSSSSDATKTNLACLTPSAQDISYKLSPYSYARFSSNEFKTSVPGFVPDAVFSAGMSATAGHIRLLDKDKNEIDKIGWGTAASPETTASPAHASGKILLRKQVANSTLYQDTNNNLDDFSEALLNTIPESGIVEYQNITDVCLNIDGPQATIPSGYLLDGGGNCIQDRCENLDGLQEAVPSGYESNDSVNCTLIPVVLESSPILITEMLPNASSVDTGKEFIELFNPNGWDVELEGYQLQLGPSYTKTYTLKKQLLGPFAYTSFSDILTGLVLPNSSASLRLIAPAGMVVDETPAYSSPTEDEAWALINDVWQYTNVLTPALVNAPSTVTYVTVDEQETLEPCPAGKYRNPETNRCKNIETDDTELKPCDVGQVRNPETNRCRSVASSDSLTPCKEGQERNPETNRCRTIVTTASALVPCDPGEERNPETNRCRKAQVAGASTLAEVKDVPAASSNSFNWWVVGAAIFGLAGYAIYEWRSEFMRAFDRFRSKP